MHTVCPCLFFSYSAHPTCFILLVDSGSRHISKNMTKFKTEGALAIFYHALELSNTVSRSIRHSSSGKPCYFYYTFGTTSQPNNFSTLTEIRKQFYFSFPILSPFLSYLWSLCSPVDIFSLCNSHPPKMFCSIPPTWLKVHIEPLPSSHYFTNHLLKGLGLEKPTLHVAIM